SAGAREQPSSPEPSGPPSSPEPSGPLSSPEPSGPTSAAVASSPPAPGPPGRPVLAGILTALVGFTSSFAVVLTGLRGVGASPAEAASGLLAGCATQGLGILWLGRRARVPLTPALVTPRAP